MNRRPKFLSLFCLCQNAPQKSGSFGEEPYKNRALLGQRPRTLGHLLIVATPCCIVVSVHAVYMRICLRMHYVCALCEYAVRAHVCAHMYCVRIYPSYVPRDVGLVAGRP